MATMMRAKLHSGGKTIGDATGALMGMNLDWLGDVPGALLSQRLENPTFWGPPDPSTGLPRPYRKMFEFVAGVEHSMVPGANLAGGPALRLHVFDVSSSTHPGFVQPNCWVRRGETLRLTVWARCQGKPAVMELGFGHRAWAGPIYGSAQLSIDASHYQPYHAEVTVEHDDDQAVFFCFLRSNGMVYIDRVLAEPVGEPLFRSDTLEAIRQLEPGTIRWPAGCLASTYHWRNGVGPAHLRYDGYDQTFHGIMNYTAGTDEYLDLCRRVGATPHFVVNIATGTPDEAGEWAGYVARWHESQGAPLPAIYWQIGNEQWGAHEEGCMEPQRYPQVLRQYVPLIRRHQPRAIIVSASTEAVLNNVPPPSPWAQAIARQAADLVDVIAVHFYPTHMDTDAGREAHGFLADAHRMGQVFDAYRRQLDSLGCSARLALTEWGAFRSECHMDNRFHCRTAAPMGLWIAAMLMEMLRRCDRVTLGNGYSMLNFMPSIVARGPRVECTTYHAVQRFIRPLLPGTIIASASEGPVFTPPPLLRDPFQTPVEQRPNPNLALPWLDSLMGRDAVGRPWALLVNRHLSEPIEVELPGELADAAGLELSPEPDLERFAAPTPRTARGSAVVVSPCSLLRLTAAR
jgi:hypothetical protein